MTPVSGDLDLFGLPAGGSKFDDLPNEAEPAYLTLRVPCLQCQATSLQVDGAGSTALSKAGLTRRQRLNAADRMANGSVQRP